MIDHARALADRLRALAVREPPVPWRRATVHAIGGLCCVGFSASGAMLLVVSHQGRGVFDCSTGKRVSRDPDAFTGGHPDPLLWDGIGPMASETVRTSGLWGGGLHTMTPDDWSLAVEWFDWPNGTAFLQPPGRHYAMPERGEVFKLPALDSYVTSGFSPDGRTLVIAESHTLTLYTRAE